MTIPQEFIKGYQWSPEDKKFTGEYVFPKNKDGEEIHMPPFTTLISPPISEKGYSPYWNGSEWYIDVDPNSVVDHPPIDDYEMLMPDYIDYLKENDLWTADDENKRQEALDNIENRRIEEETKREEFERNRDYLAELRKIRDQLLTRSDWTQLPDVQDKITSFKKEEWSEYRQKLRDLPENIQDPKPLVLDLKHPDWPISPA
jgi:hypothetical protein